MFLLGEASNVVTTHSRVPTQIINYNLLKNDEPGCSSVDAFMDECLNRPFYFLILVEVLSQPGCA